MRKFRFNCSYRAENSFPILNLCLLCCCADVFQVSLLLKFPFFGKSIDCVIKIFFSNTPSREVFPKNVSALLLFLFCVFLQNHFLLFMLMIFCIDPISMFSFQWRLFVNSGWFSHSTAIKKNYFQLSISICIFLPLFLLHDGLSFQLLSSPSFNPSTLVKNLFSTLNVTFCHKFAFLGLVKILETTQPKKRKSNLSLEFFQQISGKLFPHFLFFLVNKGCESGTWYRPVVFSFI